MKNHTVRLYNIIRIYLILIILSALVTGCNKSGSPTLPDSEPAIDTSSGQATEFTNGNDPEATSPKLDEPGWLDEEVLVVLNDPTIGAAFTNDQPLELIRRIDCRWGSLFRFRITDDSSVEEMAASLRTDSRVRFAEPNYICYFQEEPYFPDDPMWAYTNDPSDPRDSAYDQWGPSMIGASIVWNETKGTEDVVIAIMDTGVRFDHEDLEANIWNNVDEIPDNDIDDDLNGWIDDTWGWDTWDNDNDPYDDGSYASYHGTACSGVAAAVQDNALGVTGIAPGSRIMAIKVDLTGSGGLVSTVTAGMDYAAVNRADIVSMSFGTPYYSDIMELACEDAWDEGNGPILMASAGNSDSTAYLYPTAYDVVMTIGATVPFSTSLEPIDEQRIISGQHGYYWGSSYGNHLSVMGFGAQYTTTSGVSSDSYRDGYDNGFFGGTSNACPMSAGVMALIRSYFPYENQLWSWTRLEETADDLYTPGFDIQSGHGRVNALRAIYGSDRFSDQEGPLGFVTLVLPDTQVFDTIHDVLANPYQDTEDLYRFITNEAGFLVTNLDIFTWGEDLDIAMYSDQNMTDLVGESTGPNHAYSSSEEILMQVDSGVEYFLKVYSPALGSSSTYGLRVFNTSNALSINGEDITPPFIHHGGDIIPFLKLTLDIGYLATLDEIMINKSGSLSNPNWAKARLYLDSNASGDFDVNDELIAEEFPPATNRVRFSGLDRVWTFENPLVLFVAADISDTLDECTVRLSLESYKDVSTVEGVEAHYTEFPIISNLVTIGTDTTPPEWVTTTGAQTTDPHYHGITVGWNEATDLQTPPAKYNIYYSDTLPFDIGTADKATDVNFQTGDTTDYEFGIGSLPEGVEHHFVVRAEDQAGNEEDNLVVVSGIPTGGGDPENPMILNTYELNNASGLALNDNLLLVADGVSGLEIFDRSDPVNLIHTGSWDSDTVFSVCCDNSYAYIGCLSEFRVIDITEPSGPFMTDHFYSPYGYEVGKEGNWVYCVNYIDNLLVPVDVTNPDDIQNYPPLYLPFSGWPRDLVINGDEIYIAHLFDGFLSIDRSTPEAPSLINTFGDDYIVGLETSDDILYGVNWISPELSVYDIGIDPYNPPMIGSTSDGPGDYGVDLVRIGDYVYVVREFYGIAVFDVSVPTDPESVGDLPIPSAYYIATDGEVIYVLSSADILYVIV